MPRTHRLRRRGGPSDLAAASQELTGGQHAGALLALFDLHGTIAGGSDHPALAWRRAGLMEVTGRPDGPGLTAPVALTAAADGALAALGAIAPEARLPANGAVLLGERARLLGLRRGGGSSAGGSCRLLAARGGHIALNLPRIDDWEVVPAWLEQAAPNWAGIARIVASRDADALVERAELLGLAAVRNHDAPPRAAPFVVTCLGHPRPPARRPLVVDLSALWAGPLAGALLLAAGARVIKVEAATRPDGARSGHSGFFDLLNAGKESVALDFDDANDRRRLQVLVDAADIVIESSRPRALEQVGINAARVAARGATWVSITAHGRAGARSGRIGFGDDAAVAGGTAAAMARGWGEPMFAGDAVADPLTGITAAFAGYASHRAGGARLVSLALADVVAHACRYETRDVRRWQAMAERDVAPLYRLRSAPPGRRTGADNVAVLAEFDRPDDEAHRDAAHA